MAKRYYWLKLQEDFFSSPRIKKLRKIAGGDTFTIIYLKMQLLSVKSGGILAFQGIEETFEEELSLILDEDAENVKVTVAYLMAQGLMEQSNGNFLLPQAAGNIGSESESAKRMRVFRRKASLCDAPVTPGDENVTLDIDGDKEGDRDGDEDSAPARDPAVAAVMDAYMNRIDPTPSPSSMDELKGYIQTMGPECCIRAIDAALNAKAATWNYVRRVLQTKASQGVRCIADWDAIEARREQERAKKAVASDAPPNWDDYYAKREGSF